MSALHFPGTRNLPACPCPVVHLNGTGRADLKREWAAVHDALESLQQALADATCNGRDYYVISETAYNEARTTRTAAFRLLDELETYVDYHREAIS